MLCIFQVSGWETTSGVTVRALNKMKSSLELVQALVERNSLVSSEAKETAAENAAEAEELRQEVEGMWGSVEKSTQRINDQQKQILGIKVLYLSCC